MSRLKDLPIAGKFIGRGIKWSTIAHIILICVLVALSIYSQQRIEELTRLKEEQVEQEKQDKIEDAVAEQQLEHDLKEVLEELNPDATAEEIEELQEALEEQIDKEELKENLIASMDEENPEQQESQEEYLDTLQEEISAHLSDAIEATEDDILERELLEELVYEDLPELDNNLENALKRDDLESLVKQTLADKVNELSALAKKQIDRERHEAKHGKQRDEQHREQTQKLNARQKRANAAESDRDAVIAAAQAIAQQTKRALDTLQESNPYAEKSVESVTEQVRSELEKAETAYQQAKQAEQHARKDFQDKGREAIAQIAQSMAQNKEVDSVKKAANKVEHIGKEASKRLLDEKRKTQDAMAKIKEMHGQANRALAQKKEAASANSDATTTANKAQQQHQKASDQLNKAKSAMMRKAMDAHKRSVQDATHMLRQFARSKEHKESIDKLRKTVDAHKRQGTPKSEEQLQRLKQAIAEIDASRKQFAQDVNERREESLAQTQRTLNELKEMTTDVMKLQNLEQADVREATIAALKDTMIQGRIEQKAEHLRENLKHGSEAEKKQRTKQFKQDAADTVAAAQAKNESLAEGAESAEEHSEASKVLPSLTMSETLQEALAQKLDESNGAAEKGEDERDDRTDERRKSSGLRGIEVESDALAKTIKNRWQFRTLSIAEKQKILVQNTVTTIAHAPPQLRFARPTLDAAKENTRSGSADIFVGQIDKRDIAKLDPNRPRQSHPKFKATDFSAVPYCRNIPVLDGDASDWNLERTRLSKGKDVFMQWRPDGLYVLALVRDRSGSFEKASVESMTSSFWDYDTMEIWFDMKNSKAKKTDQHACQQFWACPDLPGIDRTHQLWEIVWGQHGRKVLRSGPENPYIGSSIHKDGRGYNLEYFIPRALLTNLKYFRAGQVLGFLYVINSSHNANQMQSSLANFNPNFHYSSQPSSWGNLQLLGTDAVLNTLTASGEAAEYPSVEVSQSLGLMVDDPDSNTDIGAVNAITVRVKNRFGFDGRQKNEAGEEFGDWEDVRLLETGKNTGIFKGWVRTTLMPSSTGDQKLGVQPGDTLDVLYSDYVRMAGEYDEKMRVEVAVVSPVLTVMGARKPSAEQHTEQHTGQGDE